ncbi:MAG: DUF2961 domain-containing protein [Phycisphaerae bacterium]|jgi:hypothetical protein
MRTSIPLVGLLLIGTLHLSSTATAAVTTRSLLAEMVDLEGLAGFPQPAYTCRQFSSYNRKSKSPEEDWFANGDCGNYLSVEERDGQKEYVLMDADGPGAIVRIWSANPKGTLRIYLDGGEAPALEARMSDLLGSNVEGIPKPLAGERSHGWNCHFPFAYAKHCKVTSDEGGFYYHVNYRTYAPGTEVTTFAMDDLKTLAGDVERVAKRLAEPRGTAGEPAWTDEVAGDTPPEGTPPAVVVQPGMSTPWRTRSPRPSAITGLRVKVYTDDPEDVLRGLLLTASFDGEQTIECPLGDFFGAGPGLNPYASLPLGITEDGELWCHWVMPYQQSAEFEIHNMTDEPVRLRLGVGTTDYEWPEGFMHFHAQWRQQRDLPSRPMQDWNYVHVKGQGVFVGAAFSIANPTKNWWGEGDEKIYVDGETFPSHFGTGTEDYYGYAWCCNLPFVHAYHSQPRCDGPGNYGRSAVNRWHILDNIPFRSELRFDMELWHGAKDVRVAEMSVVTYWYAVPGAWSNREPVQAEDLTVTKLPPYVPPRVAGALEGEELRIVEKTGTPAPQGIDRCSNEQHLWWREAQPGDRLVVAFPVETAGRYRVLIRCVKANDYGIVQFAINGQPAGEPLDFYADRIVVTDELPLGEFDLTAGENQLGAEIVGANDEAKKSYMFGLDYIRLEPAAEQK